MKKFVFALAVVAAALCACNKAETLTSVNDEARIVKFSMGNFYSFNTRAAIAADTHVAIYAGTPINALNQDYTVSAMPVADPATAGTLSGSSILWGLSQIGTDTETKFFAMYPYASSEERNAFDSTHDINYEIDASSESEEYAKDFLVDVVDQAPGGDEEHPNTVSFNLHHPFAMLRYVITNTSDDAIQKVEIYGVHKTGTLAYDTAEITASGNALTSETLVAMPLEGSEGNVFTYYSIIVPEGNINPTIKLTTWGGCTCTYQLTAAQAFVAGKTYTAAIAYSNTHNKANSNRTMTATFNVTDWEAASNPSVGSQNGYNGNDNAWPYIKGTGFDGAGDNWSGYVSMSCVGQNSFKVVLSMTGNGAFKIYKDSQPSATWMGMTGDASSDNGWTYYSLAVPGSDIPITATNGQKCTIYYYTDTAKMYYKVDSTEQSR